MEKKQIQQILEQHKNLNFVQRVLNPDAYPSLDLDGGWSATHMMSDDTIEWKPTAPYAKTT